MLQQVPNEPTEVAGGRVQRFSAVKSTSIRTLSVYERTVASVRCCSQGVFPLA